MLLTSTILVLAAVAAIGMILFLWGCLRGFRSERSGAKLELRLKKADLVELVLLNVALFVTALMFGDELSQQWLTKAVYGFYLFSAIAILLLGWCYIGNIRVQNKHLVH